MKKIAEGDFNNLISGAQESRNIEFKPGFIWDGEGSNKIREELVKAMISMSNIPQGGTIILGIKTNAGKGENMPVGVTPSEFTSFERHFEHIEAYIHRFCSEPISFTISFGEADISGNGQLQKFIIIQVAEFEIYPTVCVQNGKSKEDGNKHYVLEENILYTRPKNAPWSSKKAAAQEIREIILLAADKYRQDLKKRGYVKSDDYRDKLKQERSDYE